MRPSLFALASGLVVLAATPSLALTVSSAPPSRYVAQHLNQAGASLPAPRDAWGGGRPQAGSNYSSSGPVTYSTGSAYGSFQATVQSTQRDGWARDGWTSEKRESSTNPYALTPPPRR